MKRSPVDLRRLPGIPPAQSRGRLAGRVCVCTRRPARRRSSITWSSGFWTSGCPGSNIRAGATTSTFRLACFLSARCTEHDCDGVRGVRVGRRARSHGRRRATRVAESAATSLSVTCRRPTTRRARTSDISSATRRRFTTRTCLSPRCLREFAHRNQRLGGARADRSRLHRGAPATGRVVAVRRAAGTGVGRQLPHRIRHRGTCDVPECRARGDADAVARPTVLSRSAVPRTGRRSTCRLPCIRSTSSASPRRSGSLHRVRYRPSYADRQSRSPVCATGPSSCSSATVLRTDAPYSLDGRPMLWRSQLSQQGRSDESLDRSLELATSVVVRVRSQLGSKSLVTPCSSRRGTTRRRSNSVVPTGRTSRSSVARVQVGGRRRRAHSPCVSRVSAGSPGACGPTSPFRTTRTPRSWRPNWREFAR